MNNQEDNVLVNENETSTEKHNLTNNVSKIRNIKECFKKYVARHITFYSLLVFKFIFIHRSNRNRMV